MKRLLLLHMYSAYSFLYLLLPLFAQSCSTYNFSCGVYSFDIQYPFFTDSNLQCQGLHHIQCTNLIPMVQFYGETFIYPVWSISYTEKSVVINDLKLSSYFRGSDCVFLYEFSIPIPRFNVSVLTNSLNSSEQFFNCQQTTYDYSHDIFKELQNLTPCKDYSLFYASDMEDRSMVNLPRYCSTASDIWFDWKLSYGDNETDGGLSLLSVGFSRKWTPFPDCFNCHNNSDKGGGPSCGCSSQCWGITPSTKGHKFSSGQKIALGICMGIAGFIIVGILLFTLWSHFHKKISGEMDSKSVEALLKKYGSLTLKSYTYSVVKKITSSFSEKLGQGGYGTVFKGKLFDGHLVAVKVLNESKGNGEDFINEVAAIGRTSHINVVTLLGFCMQGSKRVLIYDFMSNGSLEKYINYSEKAGAHTSLGWEKLYEIAVGIARGLEYLHQGCNTRIVHFDIKPHNILLDQDHRPKLSDFGLAKLCPEKESIISMDGMRGTIGYIAPEVFSRAFGSVSSKSDVYSYGMVLLEMFGGKTRRATVLESCSQTYFPQWIYKHLDQTEDLMAYGVTSLTEEIARKMMIVGFWCIQTMPERRPSMSRVVDMLEGSINDLSIPPKPVLSSPLDFVVGSSTMSST